MYFGGICNFHSFNLPISYFVKTKLKLNYQEPGSIYPEVVCREHTK